MWTLDNLSIMGQWENNYGWEYLYCSACWDSCFFIPWRKKKRLEFFWNSFEILCNSINYQYPLRHLYQGWSMSKWPYLMNVVNVVLFELNDHRKDYIIIIFVLCNHGGRGLGYNFILFKYHNILAVPAIALNQM